MKNLSPLDFRALFCTMLQDLDIPSQSQSILLKRLDNEGITFVTVTLPRFHDFFMESLDSGVLQPKQLHTSFRFKGKAPILFSGLLSEIFDLKTGLVLDKPDVVSIWIIRQVCLYWKKLCLSFTDSQLSTAEDDFIATEQSVGTFDIEFADLMRKHLESTYKFPQHGHQVLHASRPRHGPGTFANKARSVYPFYVEKEQSKYLDGYCSRFEGISGYFKSIPSYKGILNKHLEDTAPYSEVLFVPKDSSGPRTIMREPLLALKGQMSFFDYFSSFFERSSDYRINFADQQVNRDLANLGSVDGSYSTLDLSKASDSVSFALVKQLSQNIPALSFFLRFRTPFAKLPSGRVMKLNKLAGMGSGLTFIWLALICHTSIATEISLRTGRPFSETRKEVYVYGDDIIVKTCYVPFAKDALRKTGLTLNTKKSFFGKLLGKYSCFRESCGGDYYAGNDVGVVRLKLQNCDVAVDKATKLIHFGKSSQAVAALNAHAAELRLNGLIKTSNLIYQMLRNACGYLPKTRTVLPIVSEVTREFVNYEPRDTGMYAAVKVTCIRSAIAEDVAISPLMRYSHSLKPKSGSDILEFSRPSAGQFEMAVPHSVVLKHRRISTINFIP